MPARTARVSLASDRRRRVRAVRNPAVTRRLYAQRRQACAQRARVRTRMAVAGPVAAWRRAPVGCYDEADEADEAGDNRGSRCGGVSRAARFTRETQSRGCEPRARTRAARTAPQRRAMCHPTRHGRCRGALALARVLPLPLHSPLRVRARARDAPYGAGRATRAHATPRDVGRATRTHEHVHTSAPVRAHAPTRARTRTCVRTRARGRPRPGRVGVDTQRQGTRLLHDSYTAGRPVHKRAARRRAHLGRSCHCRHAALQTAAASRDVAFRRRRRRRAIGPR